MLTGNYKLSPLRARAKAGGVAGRSRRGFADGAGGGCGRKPAGGRGTKRVRHTVSKINFMVKLLRACVWMPWRKQAMKDVASYDKPRGVASTL